MEVPLLCAAAMPPSGPHDIVSSVDNSAVRYKVYPDKKAKKKPVIKFCIGFDADDPKPEREWEQFRDDGDAEVAVRAAARKVLGGSRPTEHGDRREAAFLRWQQEQQDQAEHLEATRGERELEQAERDAAWRERQRQHGAAMHEYQERQALAGAARKATREANTKEEVMALVQPFINHADEAIARHHSTLDTLPKIVAAGSVAAANTLSAQQDRPLDERRAAAAEAGGAAMSAAWTKAAADATAPSASTPAAPSGPGPAAHPTLTNPADATAPA